MMNQTINEAVDFASSLRTKAAQQPTDPGAVFVDPNYEEDPKVAPIVEYAIKRRKNLFLVGPTGCGKSTLAIQVAARLQERLEIFSASGETTTDELIGKPWRKPDGSTVTVYGAGIRAYKNGKGLLLEEIDHANPDILASLHRLLENNQSFYTLNVGEEEIISKAQGFFVVATANTIGTGEDAFLYAGTKPLNAAFMNRFGITIRMDYLPPSKEKTVLQKKTGIDATTAEQLVNVARDAREAAKSTMDQIVTPVSTRDLLEWAELIQGAHLSPSQAADYVFLNRANEADREVLTRFVENRCV